MILQDNNKNARLAALNLKNSDEFDEFDLTLLEEIKEPLCINNGYYYLIK